MQKALVSDMSLVIFRQGGIGSGAVAVRRKSDHQIRSIKTYNNNNISETTYPTSNPLRPKLAHGLHHTPLLINDILNPIRPPRRDKNMCPPPINLAV